MMMAFQGSYKTEDLRPLRKRKPITKTKTLTKTKTHYENEDPLRKRRHITKTSSEEVGIILWTKIMFMRHTTKTKILTEILNSEFGTSVIYYGIKTVEPHGAFNETTLKLKRDSIEGT